MTPTVASPEPGSGTPHPPRTAYDASRAGRYDARHVEQFDEVSAAVSTLARLAASRPVLEFGVGTGRLAIPLAERGLAVTGVDMSAEMLELLAAKPGGSRVRLVQHDFAEVDTVLAERSFGLVFVAYSTLYELTTQEGQVRCFAGAARLLSPGGMFVVDALVPEHTGPPGAVASGRTVYIRHADETGVTIRELFHDPFDQYLHGHDVTVSPKGFEYAPFRVRYARTPELDLMARLAGLSPVHRWGNWQGEPFTDASDRHVSVYELPTTAGAR